MRKYQATGLVALIFLIIGYQASVFIHKAAVLKITANHDCPDTVYVYMDRVDSLSVDRKESNHSPKAKEVRRTYAKRMVESFRFNPNLVSKEELERLGFSEKQAQSIINYREKGGRFHRKEDFAKSFVVSDSIYQRLESFIEIPLLDLNLADSAAFDALPGIGPYFATKMVAYRNELGGYSSKEQLLNIWKFDEEKLQKISDLVFVDSKFSGAYPLWTLPADSLRLHPHIRSWTTARNIVLYRQSTPKSKWTLTALHENGVLSTEQFIALSRCEIAGP
jgi:DNA uptake protein ComE-like DNA-binding protein